MKFLRLALLFPLLSALAAATPQPGKIVMIGDSITQGAGYAVNASTFPQNGNRSWRREFFKRLVDADAEFDFVGSLTTNYTNSTASDDVTNSHYTSWRGVPFDADHEGHWGWRASQIRGTAVGPSDGKRGSGNLADWLTDYTPDSAVVMVGINDLNDAGNTPATLAADVSAIVDQLQADNPNVHIYLCELLHVGLSHPQRMTLDTAVDSYNSTELPVIAAAKTTATSTVEIVPMANPLWNGSDWDVQPGAWNPAAMTYDEVHPNSAGETYLGGRVAAAFGLVSRWTTEPVTNEDFEGNFFNPGTANCRPEGWTIFGTPNPAAVPKRLGDYSIVAEGTADTAGGTSGSSYIIAGPADTGISQVTGATIAAGRTYQLGVLIYKASIAAGPGDYTAELRANGAVLAQIPTVASPLMFITGTNSQIGKCLTEFTATFDADAFPAAIGQAVEIRLIARNNTRYIGFESVMLSSRESDPPGKKMKIFVLTGQSNSLGTLAGTDGTILRGAPGTHAAEREMHVPFFWDNLADGTPAGDAALGDSGENWVDLGPQTGRFYAGNDQHWGPEIGFARMLWNAGYRDFGIVKASRGGGGNSLWVKGSADPHMYNKVVATVNSAVMHLPADFTSYEVAALLYVQGESNNTTEADEADVRFSALLENLKIDLPGAANLKGVFGEIGGGSDTNRNLTRTRQKALAAARADIGYASSAGMSIHDGLHYVADSQLLLGERMAAEAIGADALGSTPLPAWPDLYAWYVADNAAQPNAAGTIDRWASLADGGAARDLTRTVAGRPETRPVTAVGGEAREVMKFDGNSDLWASSAEFGTLPAGRSLAVLCRVTGAADGTLFDGTTGVGRTRAQVRGGNWQAGVSPTSWDAAEPVTAPRALDSWQRHIFTFSESGAGTQVNHWIDGALAATPVDANVSDLAGLIIGSNGGAPFSRLDCEIAEFAVYNKTLAAAEVAELDAAWAARWGTPAGPPFGVSINQTSREISRFGKHALLEIAVDSPAGGVETLEEITISLKGASRNQVSALSVIGTGGSENFDAGGAVLATTGKPAEDVITFSPAAPLAEGRNYFHIAIDPERWAELDATIDARVNSLVFSGAGTVIPTDGDPAGQLTLGLTPYKTDVRTKGENGANYRIPGLACDGDGVLHAVYDIRHGFGGDLPGDIDVGYRRSVDGGTTWEPEKAILDFDSSLPNSSGNGVGDPCILWDPATNTLWVAALHSFGNHAYNGSGPGFDKTQTGQFVLTKSTDGGTTWSAPVNITTSVKEDENWNLIFNGPGHGLVMRDGTLVFPAQYRDGTISNDKINQVRSCSVFSADHGMTWQFGSAVPSTDPQTNEMTLCELDDGKLLFSCRTPVGSNGQRAWARYTPGGAQPLRDGTWEPLYRLPSVPDPVCQGSVIQWKSKFNGHPREMVLFANPATGGRNGMTLRISLDGGLSWPVSRLVDPGPSAYSSLCVFHDNSIGLLYETRDSNTIDFVRIDEEWLLNPVADDDGDGLPDSWEIIWGTDPNGSDAAADPDGDGMSNAEEYRAGTNPLDAGSRLAATGFGMMEDSLEFSWSSVPGRSYQIEDSTDFGEWSALGEPVRGTGAETSVSIPDDGSPRRFFRARAMK